jgi:hypothetical protein
MKRKEAVYIVIEDVELVLYWRGVLCTVFIEKYPVGDGSICAIITREL